MQTDTVIQNTIRSLKNMADARRVSIEFTPDRDLPPIFGDPEQLQEALKHIIHNAIKFNKIGGSIVIESETAGGDFVVRVQDTGVGIPEERIDELWQGFATIYTNGSNKKRQGVGLAFTQFIVIAHGGSISVESSYGSGSTFSVYLPLVFDE
jgi:signal transduction histidine kinase